MTDPRAKYDENRRRGRPGPCRLQCCVSCTHSGSVVVKGYGPSCVPCARFWAAKQDREQEKRGKS